MSTAFKLFSVSGSRLPPLTNGLQRFVTKQLDEYPGVYILSAVPTSLFDGENYHLTVAFVLDIPENTPPETVEAIRAWGFEAHVPTNDPPPPE